jgi:hypothetical protein
LWTDSVPQPTQIFWNRSRPYAVGLHSAKAGAANGVRGDSGGRNPSPDAGRISAATGGLVSAATVAEAESIINSDEKFDLVFKPYTSEQLTDAVAELLRTG